MNNNPNPNPNRRKPMQAFHFLRLLSRLRLRPSPCSIRKRCRAIRRAAYASMARSTGTRRAWSRAVLCRLRRRVSPGSDLRRAVEIGSSSKSRLGLRRLVPGGEGMDLCSLLEETVDYMACLRAQVELMKAVADLVGGGRHGK
ncbi:hypothetical protein HPP92_005986 [Vanilla planifolia]|uniref:IBH1-like N-terminal domain-containing protein n=1 Tax=Vanilla planifolia TaxID=51239 RepID=A0A835VDQ1_VANPL|nr:hypothetical protein HPP92_005986 [Vanilla planifolia]